MATYLGIEVSDYLSTGQWLAQLECPFSNANWLLNNKVPELDQAVNLVVAQSANFEQHTADVIEEDLYQLKLNLDTALSNWVNYQEWLGFLQNQTGTFGGATDESCDRNMSNLSVQRGYSMHIRQAIIDNRTLVTSALGTVQAYQADEIEEEIVQNEINAAINENNQGVLDNAEKAQQLNVVETLYSFQTYVLPALIIVVGYMIFSGKR